MTVNDTDKFLEIFDSLHQNLMQLEDKNDRPAHKENYSYENFSNLLYKLRFKHNWLNGKNYYFLKTCSKIRNIVSHSNHMQPIKEFNPEFIEKLESYNARFFTSIDEHCIKRQEISHLTWNSKLNLAIKELKAKDFSCLPILEDGYVQGLFSKSILVDFISEQANCILSDELKLEDIREFAKLENHQNKTIAFVNRNQTLSEVFDMFSTYYTEGRKLILVFITENGQIDQRILGMYTVWDFLKFND
jgi:predicted transcriptional regulator